LIYLVDIFSEEKQPSDKLRFPNDWVLVLGAAKADASEETKFLFFVRSIEFLVSTSETTAANSLLLFKIELEGGAAAELLSIF
jgi:hypothetical protein